MTRPSPPASTVVGLLSPNPASLEHPVKSVAKTIAVLMKPPVLRIARQGKKRYLGKMEEYPKQFEVRIEVVRGGWVKRRPDHTIDFVSPFPSPFNYGSVLGRDAPDGDPEDALVLGPSISLETVVQTPVWGKVKFLDAGLEDHKWVCGERAPSEKEWAKVEAFFKRYAWAKRFLYRLRGTSGEVRFLGIERFSVEMEPLG